MSPRLAYLDTVKVLLVVGVAVRTRPLLPDRGAAERVVARAQGPRRFAKDRLIRLGIPLAAYTLMVSRFLEYVAYRENEHGTEALWPFVREQVWHLAPGPTWFLEAPLVFSLGFCSRSESPPGGADGWRPSRRGCSAAAG